MSKQRLAELEAQYNASIAQQEKLASEGKAIIAEIEQKSAVLSDLKAKKSQSTKELSSSTKDFEKLQIENSILAKEIGKEEAVLGKLMALLSEYNEYVPSGGSVVSGSQLNSEVSSQLAAELAGKAALLNDNDS